MRKGRLSTYEQDRIIEHFVAGTTARLAGVHRNAAALYSRRLRELVVRQLAAQSGTLFGGEIEVDEFRFGGRRKGRRGRGAGGKGPVFGPLKRGGRLYTQVIPDASEAILRHPIARKVVPDSIVYSDGWRGYNALDVSGLRHIRISTAVSGLHRGRIISTGLRIFGTRRSIICVVSMRFRAFILSCF